MSPEYSVQRPQICFKHWSEDAIHEHKITRERQHAHIVMEKVSTPQHIWLHSSCLVAQQETAAQRGAQQLTLHQLQHWINHTNFTRTNPYFTSKTLVPFLSCSRASVCILISVMKYLIPFTGKQEGTSCLLLTESRGLLEVVEKHVWTKCSSLMIWSSLPNKLLQQCNKSYQGKQ